MLQKLQHMDTRRDEKPKSKIYAHFSLYIPECVYSIAMTRVESRNKSSKSVFGEALGESPVIHTHPDRLALDANSVSNADDQPLFCIHAHLESMSVFNFSLRIVIYEPLVITFSLCLTIMPVTSVTPKSARYGKFATTSRLVACLIVEDLVDAYFCPCEVNGQDNGCILIGLCLMLRAGTPVTLKDIQCLDDIFAIIPLRGLPELDISSTVVLNGTRCSKIELLDPWDMHAHVYVPGRARTLQVDDLSGAAAMYSKVIKAIRMLGFKDHETGLLDGCDANHLWCQFSLDYGVNEKISKLVASELDSAMLHQSTYISESM